jgi:hypothetical protein
MISNGPPLRRGNVWGHKRVTGVTARWIGRSGHANLIWKAVSDLLPGNGLAPGKEHAPRAGAAEVTQPCDERPPPFAAWRHTGSR